MQKRKSKKKGHRKWIWAVVVLIVLAVPLLSLVNYCQIKEVTVKGNVYYTKEQIVDFVIEDGYKQNTIYLYFKYKYMEQPKIPFIDTLEVEIESPNKVSIRVYEKGVIAYVRYLGKNLYFDKDGIVVESSSQEMDGIPLVTGFSFEQFSMNQVINVENPEIFKTILDITKLLDKYKLDPDEIRFGKSNDLYFMMDEVKVALGTGDNLEEKVARLKQLEEDLVGKKGTLHMENYTEDTMHISLELME